jgi:3-methylcrotonyl-CoA carboxylase alpha subunit
VFAKLLIANRGEIACRVARTARRMGIATVAVYSDADARALHRGACDEAVRIGPAPARDSYLSVEAVLQAARRTGADAVHPGYGFLSENAAFAEACAAAGLVFVGPPPAAIRAMGSKSAAKALMEKAGVPLLPGYHGADQDAALLAKEARRIGFPVLIKASAGGGGKGMRIVGRARDFDAALAACRREAASGFGDDAVLIEKYLPRVRHVEIQVFADAHGGCIHLFERDCSVQRRHQKVLEEAPAPGMTPAQRARMGAAAVAAARAVGYEGAGTVEFLLAPDGAFYFMEMNTRLQVEHPVTEMITGLDLVEWQLRVAAGEPLPLAQAEVKLDGHAIEARIYAEDPGKGFLPATGRLVHFRPPGQSREVRVDAGVAQGVEQGGEVTSWYDPMLAKLIVWDSSRDKALARMRDALSAFEIAGVANNVAFLSRLVATSSFAAADLDTALIERERERLFAPRDPAPREAWLLAALGILRDEAAQRPPPVRHDPWDERRGWRLNGSASRVLELRDGAHATRVTIRHGGEGCALDLDGRTTQARAEGTPGSRLTAWLDGRRVDATVVRERDDLHVFAGGGHWRLAFQDPLRHRDEGGAAEGALVAPMPGRVVALHAEAGSRVRKGEPLLVLEAMKMEHTIVAPADGTLKAHRYAVGDQVAPGAQLVDFDADARQGAS